MHTTKSRESCCTRLAHCDQWLSAAVILDQTESGHGQGRRNANYFSETKRSASRAQLFTDDFVDCAAIKTGPLSLQFNVDVLPIAEISFNRHCSVIAINRYMFVKPNSAKIDKTGVGASIGKRFETR